MGWVFAVFPLLRGKNRRLQGRLRGPQSSRPGVPDLFLPLYTPGPHPAAPSVAAAGPPADGELPKGFEPQSSWRAAFPRLRLPQPDSIRAGAEIPRRPKPSVGAVQTRRTNDEAS